MTIGGIIVLACILTVFTAFAATLVWGVRQTNAYLRDQESQAAKNAGQSEVYTGIVEHAKAA